MLDLNKLEKMLDEALSKETSESLIDWMNENTIQRMVDDKKVIREYIKEYGTLEGFKGDTIKRSKPF